MKISFKVKFVIFLSLTFYTISFTQIKGDSTSSNSDSTGQSNSVYRVEYTFEEADSLVAKSEYAKAVWFYINLYPTNPEKSVESIRKLNGKVKDVAGLVRMSFTIYAPFDPASSNLSSGSLQINSDNLKVKAKWVDAIIEELKK